MLKLWGMRITPSFPSLPDPLWPVVVAPDRATYVWVTLCMGKIAMGYLCMVYPMYG